MQSHMAAKAAGSRQQAGAATHLHTHAHTREGAWGHIVCQDNGSKATMPTCQHKSHTHTHTHTQPPTSKLHIHSHLYMCVFVCKRALEGIYQITDTTESQYLMPFRRRASAPALLLFLPLLLFLFFLYYTRWVGVNSSRCCCCWYGDFCGCWFHRPRDFVMVCAALLLLRQPLLLLPFVVR